MIAFTHGVASGDPTSDGVVLWTRVVDRESPGDAVALECVVTDGRGAEVRRVAAESAPARDHTVHVAVDGLEPGSRYEYRFHAVRGEAASPPGRFRTLPDGCDALSVAVVSCAKFNAGFFHVYAALAEHDELAFVVHLGDYIYEAANVPPSSQTPGAGIGRDMSPLHECRTLDDYRRRYAQYRADPALQAAHAAHAFVATIDDHELADNAWSGGAQEHRDEEHGPWADRLAAALTAWEEWMPVRARPTRGDSIHTTVPLGELGTVVLLEARTNRSDPLADGDARTQLGGDQLRWLERTAAGVRGRWLVVGSPSPLFESCAADMDAAALDALTTLKVVEAGAGGPRPFFDAWGSYPEERDRVLRALAGSPADAIVVSGDVHVACSADLAVDGAPAAVEWTTPSITSQNLDDKRGWGRRTESLACERALQRALPHLRWANLDDHGFMVVTLDASSATCEWWIVDSVTAPSADVSLERAERHAPPARRRASTVA